MQKIPDSCPKDPLEDELLEFEFLMMLSTISADIAAAAATDASGDTEWARLRAEFEAIDRREAEQMIYFLKSVIFKC